MADCFFGDPLKKILINAPVFREWTGSMALMDWLETPSSHIYKINVPGYSEKDLKLYVEEGKVLHVSGEGLKEDSSAKDAIWRVAERGGIKGEFSRVIGLPENVESDEIKAHVENGVLTIIVPKDCSQSSQSPYHFHLLIHAKAQPRDF